MTKKGSTPEFQKISDADHRNPSFGGDVSSSNMIARLMGNRELSFEKDKEPESEPIYLALKIWNQNRYFENRLFSIRSQFFQSFPRDFARKMGRSVIHCKLDLRPCKYRVASRRKQDWISSK